MFIKRCLLGILLMHAAVGAYAADRGWYGAVDLGATSFKDVEETRLPPNWKFDSIADSSTGGRLSFGYGFNDSFALEAGYADLGKASFDAHYAGTAPLPAGLPSNRHLDIDASALSLTGIGTYHVSPTWSLSGRLAVMLGFLKVRGAESGNGVTNAYTQHSSDFKFGYGFGVNWNFAPAWTARLGWDRYNVGDTVNTGSYVIHMTSLGLAYHF